MELIIGLIVAAAVLAALFWLAGRFLPRTHVARQQVTIASAPEKIWPVLTDYPSQPTWHPEIEKVEALPNHRGRRSWREVHKSGERNVVRELEAEAPRRIVWRFSEEHDVFRARWEVELARVPQGTAVTISQFTDLKSPLVRVLALGFIGRNAHLKLYLRSLKDQVEGNAASG